MTDNKQHIKNLKKLKSFHNGSYGADIDRSIKALEQEDILDKIRAEINEEYRVESEHPYGQGLRRALQIIDKYKAESEVSND